MHPLDVKKHIFGPYPEKFATDKHWPPETTAVSVWTSARTSWVWFLKVLVLTHWLFSWPIVEARAWNWTTVPSDVPAITLLSSCRTETIRLTLQWQRHTPTNAHTHTPATQTDPGRPTWWSGGSWSEFLSPHPRSGLFQQSRRWWRCHWTGRPHSKPPPRCSASSPTLAPPGADAWRDLRSTPNVQNSFREKLSGFYHQKTQI